MNLYYRLKWHCIASSGGTWRGSLAQLPATARELNALVRAGLIRYLLRGDVWHVWIVAEVGA